MKQIFAAVKKSKKAVIAVLLVLALSAAVLLPRFFAGKSSDGPALRDTTVLSYGDFTSSIPASGTVESAESTMVYSTLPYTVQAVYVEVGDTVEEGQLLCELDGESIQDQIRSQQTTLSSTQSSHQAQLDSARASYEHFKEDLENGLNSTMISAQSQVDTAYDAYIRAENSYERFEESVRRGENSALLSAESALRTAESAYDSAKEAYDNGKLLYAEDSAEVKALQQALSNAEDAYDSAETAYRSAKRTVNDTLEDYEAAVDTAWNSYQTALQGYDAAAQATQEQLEGYERNLTSLQTSSGTETIAESLRQLRVDLSDTKLKAPVSGTVTAVYATVGGSGSGLLFVIEDIHHLVVETSIEEYDLGTVQVGMAAEISSHATGDKTIRGTVTKIAPTANKNAAGETDTLSDPSFAVELSVDEADSGLYIGMEVQLDYETAALEHVLTAPYDAVYENDAGEDCVLVLTEQADGKYLLSEHSVHIDAAGDLDVVISGIDEGTRIVNEPENYRALVGKTVSLANAEAQ